MQAHEILPGIEIIGLTLYIKDEGILVFSDLHLGFEEELNQLGYLVPRFQYKEIISHLNEVFSLISSKKKKVKKMIIDGDLKHEFGRISEQEWKEVLNFLDFLGDNCDEIILIKGNHDTIIGPIASRKNLEILDNYFLKDKRIYITHGHKIPEDEKFQKSRIIIIAHGHPAFVLREEIRTEKIKCFLKGMWNMKALIQIPSLNFITEGSGLLQEETISPFMQKNLGNFEVYGVEGFEVFYFGKLRDLKK